MDLINKKNRSLNYKVTKLLDVYVMTFLHMQLSHFKK